MCDLYNTREDFKKKEEMKKEKKIKTNGAYFFFVDNYFLPLN